MRFKAIVMVILKL